MWNTRGGAATPLCLRCRRSDIHARLFPTLCIWTHLTLYTSPEMTRHDDLDGTLQQTISHSKAVGSMHFDALNLTGSTADPCKPDCSWDTQTECNITS